MIDLDSGLVLDQADAEEQVAIAWRFTERHGRPERHAVVALVLHGDIR